MSGLIKRNLVLKSNNLPAKYMLTSEGRTLAHKLVNGNVASDTDSDANDTESPKTNKIQKMSRQESAECLELSSPIKQTSPKRIYESTKPTIQSNDFIEIGSDTDSDIITITETKQVAVAKSSQRSMQCDDDELPDIDMLSQKSAFNYDEYEVKKPAKTKPVEASANITNITNKKFNVAEFKKVPSTKSDNQISSSYSASKPDQENSQKSNSNMSVDKDKAPHVIFSYHPADYEILLFIDNCEQTA